MSQAKYRTKHTWPCATCGQTFSLNPLQAQRIRADNTASVFCSRKCAGVTPAAPLICAQCAKPFDAHEYQRRRRNRDGSAKVYCCRECYAASKRVAV